MIQKLEAFKNLVNKEIITKYEDLIKTDTLEVILYFGFTETPVITQVIPFITDSTDEDKHKGLISLYIEWNNGASLFYSSHLVNFKEVLPLNLYGFKVGFHQSLHSPIFLNPADDDYVTEFIVEGDTNNYYEIQNSWDSDMYPPESGSTDNIDENMLSFLSYINIMHKDFSSDIFNSSDFMNTSSEIQSYFG